MEGIKSRIKLNDRTTRYIIFICIGLVLMIAGSSFGGSKPQTETDSREERLEKILGEIEGVGETQVMLNYENDKAIGAIIVSKGAKNAAVRQKITSAASAALGINCNKIEVFEKN